MERTHLFLYGIRFATLSASLPFDMILGTFLEHCHTYGTLPYPPNELVVETSPVTTLLLVVLIGFVLIPVMAVVSVVPFVHAGYAAYRVSQGED